MCVVLSGSAARRLNSPDTSARRARQRQSQIQCSAVQYARRQNRTARQKWTITINSTYSKFLLLITINYHY